jgi:hypothetical protein
MAEIEYREEAGNAIFETTNDNEWIRSDRIVVLSDWT